MNAHGGTYRLKSFIAGQRGSITESSTSQVTQLLRAWNEGDQSALEKLTPIVYDELRRMARQYMAYERPSHTLQSAALVNEVYLRLVDSAHANWQNRIHFFAVCAQAMRRILVDWARSRQAIKRRRNPAAPAGRSAGRERGAGCGPDHVR